MTYGPVPTPAGSDAATPAAHVPDVSLNSSPWSWRREPPEVSSYAPTAVQFPAETHDTESRKTFGFVPAFAGREASTPAAHLPDVSLNNSPCDWPKLSV